MPLCLSLSLFALYSLPNTVYFRCSEILQDYIYYVEDDRIALDEGGSGAVFNEGKARMRARYCALASATLANMAFR